MPFVYYGGKKGVAHRYPPPAFDTIVEPFAGSAGYALAWAKPSTRVVLVEKDPEIVGVWRRLQATSAAELRSVECPPVGEPCADRLVMLSCGKSHRHTVTARIARDWPAMRDRIARKLARIRSWEIIQGDYTAAPSLRATWFVDPPYAPKEGRTPGSEYALGADSAALDYPALGEWCRARPGQVIVCEQAGATWLPFRPLFVQSSQTGEGFLDGAERVEAVWSRTPGTMQPGTPGHRRAHENRRKNRASR